jgi:hypothetical protein
MLRYSSKAKNAKVAELLTRFDSLDKHETQLFLTALICTAL